MTPAATCARNSSGVIPAPTFFCSGRRRLDASTMRTARARIDSLRRGAQGDQQLVHHEAGIDAGADQRYAPRLWRPRRVSPQVRDICGRDRPALRTSKRRSSPRRDRRAAAPSRWEVGGSRVDHHVRRFAQHRSRRPRRSARPTAHRRAPTTSPRSRPALAGSESIAPMISMESFSRIRRTMDAPMGPTPYWTTRIFFFTMAFLNVVKSQYVKGLVNRLQPNLLR